MAIDLLEFNTKSNHKTKKPVQHAETHDLESVFWVSFVCALEASIKDTPPEELHGDTTIELNLADLNQTTLHDVYNAKNTIIMRHLPDLGGPLERLRPYLEEYRERCHLAIRATKGLVMDCDEVEALMTRHIELLQSQRPNAPRTPPVTSAQPAAGAPGAGGALDHTGTRSPSVPSTPKRKRSLEDPHPVAEGASPKRPKTPQSTQSPRDRTPSKSDR